MHHHIRSTKGNTSKYFFKNSESNVSEFLGILNIFFLNIAGNV